ncbi:efflux transporter outer membrane subunit [Lysobacter pythonis]|uniref:Efflux transporter outer membrane subunit n=1 Tax=Solilutibacter pythonis TaxID=2483112 RepID=A0A3M2HMM0_9GAMM|nr:efflux transporter outer membrane subunit [Lysobacter pythonis]RMH90956.1 efflux transporter outer membrane subunit [Lysobacter pythonis]
MKHDLMIPTAPRFRRLPLPLLLAAALTACQTGPRADAPPLPPHWQASTAAATPLAVATDQIWWRGFGDPVLERMIESALLRNTELGAAAWRIRNAQLRAGAATQALYPTPSASANAGASKGAAQPGAPAPTWQRNYGASLGVSWELDLWGRLSDQRKVALWEARASMDDRRALALALSGNVARQYWQIALLQARRARAEESLAATERIFQLTRVQYRAGAISGLELAQAEQSLQNQQSQKLQLQQQIQEARNTFSLLFDLPPPQLPDGLAIDLSQALQATAPPIPAGIPADVLTHRPDLRAAQTRLEASLLNVRIARKNFLPGISLSGTLGTGGAALKDILANPTRSLGVGLSLPFLNVGELIRQPRIARNEYEIAVLGYRQSVYRALSEVESALNALDTQRQQLKLQDEAVTNARRIARMNEARYRAGAAPLRFWLDAQETLRQAEFAAVDARFNTLQTAANLYLALGGGTGVR